MLSRAKTLWFVCLGAVGLSVACGTAVEEDGATESTDLALSQYSACPGQVAARASTATSVRGMLQPRAPQGQLVPSAAFRSLTFSRPVAKMFPMGHKFYPGDSPITGYPHEGFDYSGTDALARAGHEMTGEPIHAIAKGRVAFVITYCKPYGQGDKLCGDGWGNHVVIDHGGVYSRYAHMTSVSVLVNQEVEPGTVIGKVGMTGWAPGPHLHLEIGTLPAGKTVDACKPTFFAQVWDPSPYMLGAVDAQEPGSAPAGPTDGELRARAIGKTCPVTSGGDSYSNLRDAPSGATVIGTVARGARVKVRGWKEDPQGAAWASVEADATREGAPRGAHVGAPAFLKDSQLGLSDCN